MANEIDYGKLIDSEQEDQQSSIQQSLTVASKTNPDTAAEAVSLGDSFGLKPDIVHRNMDEFKRESTVKEVDYNSLVQNNPGLSKWLETPDNSAIAHDDIENLAKHEKAVNEYGLLKTVGNSFISGAARGNAMMARIPAVAQDILLYPQNAFFELIGRKDLEVKSPEWLRNNPAAKYYDAQAEAWSVPELTNDIFGQIKKGDFSGAARSAVAQLAANAPQQMVIIASALSGSPTAGLGFAGLSAAAGANDIAQTIGVSPFAATTDAIYQGSFEALFEKAGTLGVLKRWENSIAKAVGKDSAKKVMAEFAKTVAYSFVAEGNEEFLTQISQDFSDYVTGVNPDALKGTIQRGINAGIIGGLSGASMTSPAALASGVSRGNKIKQANQDRLFYLALGDASKNSKLRERISDKHKDYLETITKDKPVENIYVPVEAWDVYMQSKGVDPSTAASEVGISQEYDHAKEVGKEIKIPLATWANKVVGTEHYVGLSNDIKFSEDGLTVNEANLERETIKANLEKLNEEAKGLISQEQNVGGAQEILDSEQKQVENIIFEQFKKTGKYSDQNSRNLASIYSNLSRAFGGRQKLTPMEFYQRNPITVQLAETLADIVPQQNSDVFNQDQSGQDKPAVIGDTLEYQEPGGQFYSGRVKKIEGNMATIYDSSKKRNVKVPLDLSKKQIKKSFFQSATPDRNLVVMHNLREDALSHADKMGGLAVPSLSIGKAEHPLESFGDITLIGNKNLIDPTKASNKVFNADIYSPRYPRVIYEPSSKVSKEMAATFKKESDDLGRSFYSELDSNEFSRKGIDAIKESGIVQLHYLRLIGEDVSIPKKKAETTLIDLNPKLEKFLDTFTPPSDLYKNKEFIREYKKAAKAEAKRSFDRLVANGLPTEEAKADAKAIEEAWFEDNNPNYNVIRRMMDQISAKKDDGKPDFYMAESAIREKIKDFRTGYDAWVESQFSDIVGSEKIYSHEGPAPNYNRVYLRHTLDNVVRVMKRDLQSGEGFNYGLGNIRASVAKKYKNIKEIQSDRNKIISQEEFEKVKEFTDNEFDSILAEAQKVSTDKGFGVLDNFVNVLIDGIRSNNIKKELEQYGFPGMDVGRIEAFLSVLRDMPTEYFEAKIQRAVNLNEFSGAIIPKKSSQQTKDILTKNGLKFIEYDPNKAGDRQRAINELSDNVDVFFQGKSIDALGAIIFGKQGAMNIYLLKDMNFSTALHEFGHGFLEVLRRASIDPNVAPDIKDMETKTLAWLGIDSWDKLERKHHEQFAQGFEKYLMEGKSPSEGLRKAFATFRVWLISVYRTLTGLNVELSNDIRDVFSRMIATDEEIAKVQADEATTPLIADPIKILGEEKGQRYIQAVEEAKSESEANLQFKLMDEYQRARRSWWIEEYKKKRLEVADEINALPEQIALSILRRGKMPNGDDVSDEFSGLKIDIKDLVRYYSSKYDIDILALDSDMLEAEMRVNLLEDNLSELQSFRDQVGKIRRYDNDYLKEEFEKLPRRYVTNNKYARKMDEVASDLGFEGDQALFNKILEVEDDIKRILVELPLARKEFKSIRKTKNSEKFNTVKASIRELPKGITKKDGLSLDVVSQIFGYSSPEQFLDIMSRVRDRNELIKEVATQRMISEFGELLGNQEEMAVAAVNAIHNDKKETLLRMELEYLAQNKLPVLKDLIRTVSARIPSQSVVKEYSAEIIGRTTLREISPYQYQLAERRAAKAAGVALTQGKFDEALAWKKKELLNFELYRRAVEARDNVEKSFNLFKKILKSDEKIAKSRDVDYVNAARAILSLYGIGDYSRDVESYLEKTREYDPDTYNILLNLVNVSTEGAADYKTINYDKFTLLKDSVEAIWDLSKRSRQILIDGKKVELDEIRDKLIARIETMSKSGEKDKYTKVADDNDKFVRWFMSSVSQNRRVESWTDFMDGEEADKVFTNSIFNPVVQGASEFKIKNKEYTEKFLALLKGVENSLKQRDIVSDELGHIFRSKAELLGALLHTGNESNLSKLLRGRGWAIATEDGSLDTSRWDAFISRMQTDGTLTKQDYDFIQNVWDLFDEIKPAAQRAHKEMYGYYFNTVTSREFTTPFGNYRGGYAPAIVDPFANEDAAIRREKENVESINNSFMFPTTGRGFTMSRIENYSAPLAMDLRLVTQHLNKVLRFVYIEPRVKDVGRIIRNKEFRDALFKLDETIGQDMLAPWLQRSAKQVVETPDKSPAGWRLWREIRTRTGVNLMALNVVNTLQQFTGLSIAAVKVNPKYLRNSLWNYIRSSKVVADKIRENSEFMRTRTTTQMVEIQNTIDDLIVNQGKYQKAIDFAKQHAYFMQQGTQSIVDMVVWPAAYDQSVAEGRTHNQAVKDADAAVRLTQGDFSPESLSNFEAGNSFFRGFTMFYSYFNMQANLLGTEFSKVARDYGLKRGAGKLFYIYLMGFMIPAVVSQVILKSLSGEDWDKDDDGYLDDILAMFFGSQFVTATAMIPFAGQVINAGINKANNKAYDDDIRFSPAISMIESAVHSPVTVYKAIADDGNKKEAIRDFLSLMGLLTGAPVLPLAKPIGYLSEVSEGNVSPENPYDFARGLVTGKTGQ